MRTTESAAVGWSAQANAFACGQAAARAAANKLAGAEVRCVIAFASSWFDQQLLLEGVRSVFDAIPVVGGSTAGEITANGPHTHSCAVLAITGEDLALSIGHAGGLEEAPRQAGYLTAQQAVKTFGTKPRRGMIFFGDGLLTGYAEVLRGMQEVLGTSSLVTGALMADELRFNQTTQYAGDRVLTRGIVGLLLGGACSIGVGVEHGFEPISKPRHVTRAHANILYELDGQPASSVYEEYFGSGRDGLTQQIGLSRRLVAYPLGVQLDNTGHFLLRNIMAFGHGGLRIDLSVKIHKIQN